MKHTNHTLIYASLAIASLLLQGCFSGKITPLNGISVPYRADIEHFAGSPLEDTPYDEDLNTFADISMPPSIARLNNHDFVLLRRPDENLLNVEKYGDSLNLVWAMPIKVTELEYPTGIFARDRKVIVFTSRFDDENDSVKAIGHIIDPATGALQRSVTLDSKPGNTEWVSKTPKKGYSSYGISFSPDSSRIMVFNKDYTNSSPDEENRAIGYNVMVLDLDLNVKSRGRIDYNYNDPELDAPYGLWVSNGGMVYTVSNARGDTLIVNRHDLGARTIRTWRYIHDKAEVGGDESKLAGGVAVAQQGLTDESISLATIAQNTDENRMASILVLKFETGSDAPKVLVNNKLPDDLAETMVDEKYFTGYQLRDFRMTPAGNALVFVEQTYISIVTVTRSSFGRNSFGYSYSYPVLNGGPMAIFAYDATGAPVWRNAYRKMQRTSPSIGLTEISYNVKFTPDGKMQLLYLDRQNDGLLWGTLNAETGEPGPVRQLMDFGNAAMYLRPYTTWLDDGTVVIVGTDAWDGEGVLQMLKVNVPM